MKLPRTFYEQPTLEVAMSLLGKHLVRHLNGQRLVGRIVETEAYVGPEDRASHASRGRTRRTEVMFGPAGHAYVYLIYGLHHCLNVVTESEGYPAAVLIRAIEPLAGIELATRGPALLCKALSIDRRLNGADLTAEELYIDDAGETRQDVVAAPRIGVSYAGEYAAKPWRFYLKDNPYVSRR